MRFNEHGLSREFPQEHLERVLRHGRGALEAVVKDAGLMEAVADEARKMVLRAVR